MLITCIKLMVDYNIFWKKKNPSVLPLSQWLQNGISKVKVSQSCLTLYDPMDCTVHGILQARILQWVAFPFSRGSSQARNWTQVFSIAGWILYQLSPKGVEWYLTTLQFWRRRFLGSLKCSSLEFNKTHNLKLHIQIFSMTPSKLPLVLVLHNRIVNHYLFIKRPL